MALRLLPPPIQLSSSSSKSQLRTNFLWTFNPRTISNTLVQWRPKGYPVSWRRRREGSDVVMACVKLEQEKNVSETGIDEWGKVSAVLFDMDGVLCNSEDLSRRAGVELFAEMGVQVAVQDFVPFMGTGKG